MLFIDAFGAGRDVRFPRQGTAPQPDPDHRRYAGILAGHVHFSFESMLTETPPQIVTGGGYEGIAREVTLV